MLNKKLLIIGLVATFSFGSGLAADGKVYLQQAQAEYAEYEKSYIDDDARNRAKALFEQAAQAGEVEALLKLAEIARHDNDYSKSELLLKQAIDKGSDQACRSFVCRTGRQKCRSRFIDRLLSKSVKSSW